MTSAPSYRPPASNARHSSASSWGRVCAPCSPRPSRPGSSPACCTRRPRGASAPPITHGRGPRSSGTSTSTQSTGSGERRRWRTTSSGAGIPPTSGTRRSAAPSPSFLRAAASPGAALVFEGLQRDTDIRDVLATIQVPVLVTQRTGVEVAPVEEGRYMAANIPGARLLELDGTDFNPFTASQEPLMDAIERFCGAAQGLRPTLIASWRRCCSRISSARRRRPFGWLTGPGETCSPRTTAGSGPCWRDIVGARSTLPAMASSRSSTALPAPSGAAWRSARMPARSGLTCASAFTPARSSSTDLRCAASQSTLGRGSPERPAPVRSSCRARSGTSWPAPGSCSSSRGEHDLKGVPGAWRLYAATEPDPAGRT